MLGEDVGVLPIVTGGHLQIPPFEKLGTVRVAVRW